MGGGLRGSWRPPAGAQLLLCVKGSAQAVKPDVCRCAAFKKKVIPSHTVSTKDFSMCRRRSDPAAQIGEVSCAVHVRMGDVKV